MQPSDNQSPIKIEEGRIIEFLKEKRKEIDKIIEKYFPRNVEEKYLEWLLGKPRYKYCKEAFQGALTDPVWDFLDRGGKRWRPVLFLLVYEALGGKKEDLVEDLVIIPELIHNGCVTEDTYILKNPGEYVKVTEIKPGDFVYSIEKNGRLERKRVKAVKFTGIREVLEVRTRNKSIKVTPKHPFLTVKKEQPVRYKITKNGKEKLKKVLKSGDFKKLAKLLNKSYTLLMNALDPKSPQLLEPEELEFIFSFANLPLEEQDYIKKRTKFERPVIKFEWKAASELKKGDFVVVVRKIDDLGKPLELPTPSKNPSKDKTVLPEYTTPEFCQLFGYLVGDGVVTINKKGSRVYLCTSPDDDEVKAYSKLFRDLFSYNLRKTKDGALYCCSYKVARLLRKLGLKKSAKEKTIPDWIFKLPKEQKLAFIRGLLDSDGWVDKKGFAHFASASKELIEKLKLLLESLGFVTSKIHQREIRNHWKNCKKISKLWHISVGNPKLILERIGSEKRKYVERLDKKKGLLFKFSRVLPALSLDEKLGVERVESVKRCGREPTYDLMIEGTHNFVANNLIAHNTIIIDDIEDKGELRRGKPCLHKIFGEDIAINAGNFLYFFPLISAMKNKGKIGEKKLNAIYETFIQEMINLSVGQGTDIYWHKGKASEISEEEYLQMCAYKTGCLSRMSAKIAAILANADEETVEKVGKVAEAIGVAFQIQDDILDIALKGKEREAFGKAFGNDIKEGKRTLMVIHTLKKATEEDRKRLLEILDKEENTEEEIREAISILERYGSLDYARKRAREIVAKAWKEAEPLLREGNAKELLKEFVYYLIERKV